ncbi:VOC family protein [Methylobacterium brachythecii]|uniref:Glyoxalase n=1 Tax=Methylobacterium brachythecii TaxID=1176177 RepID=A0A7W6AJA3_9HYPH|nr:VOC family protein [Methylobacterium brachythecii]MBB3904420.1 putative enzyme related to lactoylglutathione lyase [Methylobacterium brachythecii]GLS43651.1 glyoxalase [Methylobacterium brachythecii]
MNFVSIRLITDDIKRLVAFYEQATGLAATWYTDDFAEIATPSCTLAVSTTRPLALFGSDIARPAANQSVIIEFRVADVDESHRALAGLPKSVVQEPTTMPWGNRSLLFRDPDGNLVNFFTPITPEAIARLDR